MIKKLWTFENQTKAAMLTSLLENAEIPYELQSKGIQKNANTEVTIFVEEALHVKAKKILVKYRKRRTET